MSFTMLSVLLKQVLGWLVVVVSVKHSITPLAKDLKKYLLSFSCLGNATKLNKAAWIWKVIYMEENKIAALKITLVEFLDLILNCFKTWIHPFLKNWEVWNLFKKNKK